MGKRVSQGVVLIGAMCLIGLLGLASIALAGSHRRSGGSSAGDGAACPSRASVTPVNHNRMAASELVPHGAIKVVLCRYYGLNETPSSKDGRLARSNPITRHSVVRRLSAAFDHLEAMPDEPISCPADNGNQIDAIFIYRRMSDDVVTVDLSGCPSVGNGRLHRGFWLSHSLKRQLLHAV